MSASYDTPSVEAELTLSGESIDPRQIRALTAADKVSSVQSGLWTVSIGSLPAISGSVTVSNFPASTQVSNFPATQPVSGTFWQATQPISGSVSVSNFPATQPVSIASMPTTPVTGTFWQATQPVSGAVTSTAGTVATAAITISPTITTASVLIIAANANRKGLILYNNSANSVYIAYGSAANSANNLTFILATFASLTLPQPVYTGAIYGIRNAGTGTVVATELT